MTNVSLLSVFSGANGARADMPKVVPEYKEQARKRIIEVAARVFSENGYYSTKMDDVAEALDVSKGAIYQYFASKEQLLFAVIDFVFDSRKDEIISILASDNPRFIATEEFFEIKIDRSLQTQSFGLDILREATRNEKLRRRLKKLNERGYVELQEYVVALKDQETVKQDADIELAWRGIVALRDGLISSILLGADVAQVKKSWNYTVARILDHIIA